MEQSKIQELFQNFLLGYDEREKIKVWEEKSNEFRDFWNNKIANNEIARISETEIDQIIRILDSRAKGNTKDSTAVARTMVPQGAWRRMFHEIKTRENIRTTLTNMLNSTDEDERMRLIDKVYKENEGHKNFLTGSTANVINAMLFAYHPTKYVSVISLNDRKKVITFFKFPNGPDFENDPVGKKVILSNRAIIEGFKSFGISTNPRTISRYLYATLLDYWKPEAGKIKIGSEEITISIPEEVDVDKHSQTSEKRESIKIQAKIAQIGETLGFKIWLPNPDRGRVTQLWKPKDNTLLEELPFAYDGSAMKIIKNIDVLWIKGRLIVRAFEVEDKTSIYSGILRMGDLLALQPNLNIKTHLVAPSERRDDVFTQVNRPVFADIGGRRLSEICSYLSYESIHELAGEEKLKHMRETVIDDSYAESLTEPF